ncbi:hypothetical protein [Dietzia psychralcaliphila]|jgi:hypothetical protein|uniref:Uncharacterized protein n=1 Tax=Dietzia psychralcaliphila TaxID=139021 RepID=A0AAD0NPV8_9ACTN|nr:hypothetical protein [Dietzia psychralcaliphila]AWH94363.1 hypothetical protein A6048_01235 [Dietzia psychralcaliphila]PTM87987.1 hypothetical protein C8N39_104205 [Dietzia psychralcaliphila]
MVRRRPAAVIGAVIVALCLAFMVIGGSVASAQGPGPGARVEVTDLPVLSELPPLPVEGDSPEAEDGSDSNSLGISGVQTVALGLAAAALVAGGMGLALVTRRGRAVLAEDQARPSGPAP